MDPIRLNRLSVRNFGPFDSADIELGPGADPELADVHLFVGPNGSGRSSLLAAIATAFSFDDAPKAMRRFRGPDAGVLISAGDNSIALVPDQVDPTTVVRRQFPQTIDWDVGEVGSRFDQPRGSWLAEYVLRAATYGSTMTTWFPPFRFAVFSYSGHRTLEGRPLTAISEVATSPFANALSFTASADPAQLIQWIAATKTQAALARDAGQSGEAEQFEAALRQVETAVSEIVGRELRFVLSRRPLAVNVLLDGESIEFDLLPDGLKSILSWVANLLMRLSLVPWADEERPVTHQPFILLLDEVEVHLHPAWQRKVLPVVQRLFPNAQIFASTHSPFVVASVSDAWIYPLSIENGRAVAGERLPAQIGNSYSTILRDVFGIEGEFDLDTEAMFERFGELKRRRLTGEASVEPELREIARQLGERSVEARDIVGLELRQLERRLAEKP